MWHFTQDTYTVEDGNIQHTDVYEEDDDIYYLLDGDGNPIIKERITLGFDLRRSYD